MIYGYIRVSSDKQTVENQRFEIQQFAERENIKIDKNESFINNENIDFIRTSLSKIIVFSQSSFVQ